MYPQFVQTLTVDVNGTGRRRANRRSLAAAEFDMLNQLVVVKLKQIGRRYELPVGIAENTVLISQVPRIRS